MFVTNLYFIEILKITLKFKIDSISLAYLCDKCGRSFKLSHQLSKHKKLHDEPAYCCDHCPRKFTFRNGLVRHMDQHKNVKYICNICNAELLSRSGLKKHLST